MLNIGSRRELFIDNLLIDRLDGASLKLQTPQPGGVAVRFGAEEGDVDSPLSGYTTVLKDGDTYRLYYRGRGYERTPRGFESLTCYAESSDGVHWTKPDLGLVEVDGSKHNNVILDDGWQFSPFWTRARASHRISDTRATPGTRRGLRGISRQTVSTGPSRPGR